MAEYIDKEKFIQAMYQESFVKDTDLQKWDSSCWIRYKLFENVIDKFPTADVQPVRWIPVTERLPEQGKRYLVIRFDEVTKTQFIDILWHDAHDLWWNRLYKGQYNVTHWMPLPEPPKDGET